MSHDNWETPPEFIKVVRDEFHPTLDAAASDLNATCLNYLTEEDNALITPWGAGVVWCNPPYSQLGAFVKRAYEECQAQGNQVLLLIPAYTDPKYWSDYVMKAHEIRFLKGRLSFLENGKKKTAARFPSVLVYFKWIKGAFSGKGPNQFVWDWRA